MITKFIKKELLYDGSQLRSHWIFEKFSIQGDAIVSFIGPCDIKEEFMCDLEDKIMGLKISGKRMVHFIGEFFNADIVRGVCLQRIFISVLKEIIEESTSNVLTRKGNDLFYKNKKLSISIASVSPLSALIHIGLNLVSEGAPIKVSSLMDLGIDVKKFIKDSLSKMKSEYEGIIRATSKVKWVK